MTDDERADIVRDYEAQTTETVQRVRYSVEFAQAGLKAIVLANGGALIGLFTFVGNSGALKPDPRSIWWAFVWFVTGLALSLLAHVGAHLSQDQFYYSAQKTAWNSQKRLAGQVPNEEPGAPLRRGGIAQAVATACAVLGLVSFVVGAAVALAGVLPR